MSFSAKLNRAIKSTGSCLCVGLDPVLNQIPTNAVASGLSAAGKVEEFCTNIIEATHALAAAYKPNLAFFENLGAEGLAVFERVVQAIPEDRLVIADAKRGDIGHTAQQYAETYFEKFNADAITLNPLMGFETLSPFLDHSDKAIFVLTRTSNSGAADFLDQPFNNYSSMAAYIASNLKTLQVSSNTHCGMVVGATEPQKLEEILKWHPKATLLIPGVGTQGGSVAELKKVLEGHKGMPVVSISRSILYPSTSGASQRSYYELVREQASQYNFSLKHLISDQVHVKT